MKTRRCIEIRTYRRRTTVILRGQPAREFAGQPPLQADAWHTVAADSPRMERAESEQPPLTRSPSGSLPPDIKREVKSEERKKGRKACSGARNENDEEAKP